MPNKTSTEPSSREQLRRKFGWGPMDDQELVRKLKERFGSPVAYLGAPMIAFTLPPPIEQSDGTWFAKWVYCDGTPYPESGRDEVEAVCNAALKVLSIVGHRQTILGRLEE